MKQVNPPPTIPILPQDFESSGCTVLYWLGGGGFMLNARGVILFIDPLLTVLEDSLSELGLPFLVSLPITANTVPKADIILYTHADPDHLAPLTAQTLDRLAPAYAATDYSVKALTDLGISPARLKTVRAGDIFDFKNVHVEVIPADHSWQVSQYWCQPYVFSREDCCGFAVTTPDASFLFPGDTRLIKEHLTIRGFDVLAMDASNDRYHLGYEDSAVLADFHEDALLIPYHYGTFVSDYPCYAGDPAQVIGRIKNGGRRVRLLGLGQPLIFSEKKEIVH